MPSRFRPQKPDLYLERMFETRSDAWDEVGLSVGPASERTIKRAQREALVLVPLLIAIVVGYDRLYHHLKSVKHPSSTTETLVQVAAVILLLGIGTLLARDIGRAAGPSFLRRMDPATAGTFGFLMRLITIVITLVVALRVAGVHTQTLAVGGAFTAVVLGLAAQQTLGNMIAGMVLLSARPFRVGERVRLQAGVVGGTAEGTVSSLGLLYTTLSQGAERMMIPNNVVLAAAIVPLKEPDPVDVRVRLSAGVRPTQVQAILDDQVTTPTRSKASVVLEEVDGSEVVVRVVATPELAYDGAKLADEIIAALSSVTGEHEAVRRDQHGFREEDERPRTERDTVDVERATRGIERDTRGREADTRGIEGETPGDNGGAVDRERARRGSPSHRH